MATRRTKFKSNLMSSMCRLFFLVVLYTGKMPYQSNIIAIGNSNTIRMFHDQADCFKSSVMRGDDKIKLHVDIAPDGQLKYKSLVHSYYRGKDIAVIFFDKCEEDDVQYWADSVIDASNSTRIVFIEYHGSEIDESYVSSNPLFRDNKPIPVCTTTDIELVYQNMIMDIVSKGVDGEDRNMCETIKSLFGDSGGGIRVGRNDGKAPASGGETKCC